MKNPMIAASRRKQENLSDENVSPIDPSSGSNGREDAPFEEFIGPALQVWRLTRGLTQEELARELSVRFGRLIRQTYISRIEKGVVQVTWQRLRLLCDVLQVSVLLVMGTAISLAEKAKFAPRNDVELHDIFADIKKMLPKGDSAASPTLDKILLEIKTEIGQQNSHRSRRQEHPLPH